MFLKRIEMQGFKSFADRVVINFENSVTGVVGPNGCGKSNISDAIRWVLGEQSVKSLRGEKMTDVIFSGSENRKPQNMAEVTLVFDNTNRYLHSDLDEIEVTRRIYNTDQEAEYLINRNHVRLKDVVDLILDSGLGKDSLSLISQGNIVSFAEAKPSERRVIFEEAAGVSRYKKSKDESIRRLKTTKENLDRTYDVLNELERQVSPLKRQAHKAELYREKKAKLQEIEICVLVDEITLLHEQLEEYRKQMFDLDTRITMHQATIQVHENNNVQAKEQVRTLENELNKLQDDLYKTINEIQILEKRKVEIDEKRKYSIEIGSTKEKIKNMRGLLEEAKIEYEDRLKRFNEYNADIEMLNTKLEEIALGLADASLKKDETISVVRKLENRREVLNNLLKDPFSSHAQAGVKAIIENKSSFGGIMGVVGQEIHAEEGYEEAISTALAGSIYHIVAKDEASSRNAIEFLKRNRSGRATFLPCTVLKRRYVSKDALIIAENTEGYIGVAADFVNCASEYDIVSDSLLGNVLVTDNLENANKLSSLINYTYKIVTLEGDVVHKGGSMTGGRVKNETSIITAERELNNINRDLESYRASSEMALVEYNDLIFKKAKIESDITEKRIMIAKLESVVDVKRSKYEKIKGEYDMLSPNNESESEETNNFFDSIVSELNSAYSKRDSLNATIGSKKAERAKLNGEIDRKEQQIRQTRKQLDEAQRSEKQMIAQESALNVQLENNINRLASEYQMTYEYAKENNKAERIADAKEEVALLRREIENLGNINMNAPEEFNEINERYEFIKKNYDDLIASRDKILKAIEEMDQIMKTQFLDTFNKINAELNNTFVALFGGGKAKLILEDPEDILNTGIDITVQPAGKSVLPIRSFSGGEKTLITICVLFTILKIRPVPLIVFDEVEAALDQANVERFAKYVKEFAEKSQFIIITHRPGTMAQCDVLYGVTMQHRGVSQMLKVELLDAIEMAEKEDKVVK